jgi:hypothetical protein
VISELNGEKINRMENVLTLSILMHYYFGRLDMWLEALEVCEITVLWEDKLM